MKLKSTIFLFAILSISILCSCTEEEAVGGIELGEWQDQLNEVDQKVMEGAGYMRLYYLNEDGTGWIDPQKPETYPVVHFEETDNPQSLIGEVKSDAGLWIYNRNAMGRDISVISYDKEEGLYYCEPKTFLDGTTDYSFPIYWNGCVDWMKLSFVYAYLIKGISSLGTKYVVFPIKCEYNGVQLFSISPEVPGSLKEAVDQKIFIRKTAEGVSVSFNR